MSKKKSKKVLTVNRTYSVAVTRHAIEQFYARVSWAKTQTEEEAIKFFRSLYRFGIIDHRRPSQALALGNIDATSQALSVTTLPDPNTKRNIEVVPQNKKFDNTMDTPEEPIEIIELTSLYTDDEEMPEEEVMTTLMRIADDCGDSRPFRQSRRNKQESVVIKPEAVLPVERGKVAPQEDIRTPKKREDRVYAMVFQCVYAVVLIQERRAVVLTCLGQRDSIKWHRIHEKTPRTVGRIRR